MFLPQLRDVFLTVQLTLLYLPMLMWLTHCGRFNVPISLAIHLCCLTFIDYYLKNHLTYWLLFQFTYWLLHFSKKSSIGPLTCQDCCSTYAILCWRTGPQVRTNLSQPRRMCPNVPKIFIDGSMKSIMQWKKYGNSMLIMLI